MKNFFQNFAAYLKFLIGALILILGVWQTIGICSMIGASEAGMKGMYIYEIIILFIVAFVFFADWYVDVVNAVLLKPFASGITKLIKGFIKTFVTIALVAFLNYQTIDIISIIVKEAHAMSTFYATELSILLIFADLFFIRWCYKTLQNNSLHNPEK